MTRPNRPNPSPDPDESGSLVRLQKVMAGAGVGSRRACEKLIEEGKVAVNGQIVRELPVLVDPSVDRVEVKGWELPRATGRSGASARQIHVMLYKPRKTLTTLADPEGRRTVGDLVRHPSGARLYPVGRLDYDTMGLVLMTNEGELANRLTHPSFGVHKTYRAVVKGALSDEHLAKLEEGIFLAERKYGRSGGASRTKPAELKIVRREKERTILDITLYEGRNRQVRRMLAQAGCPVKKLVRVGIGPLRLKGVAMGEWRELSSIEVSALRRAAGMGSRKRPARANGKPKR